MKLKLFITGLSLIVTTAVAASPITTAAPTHEEFNGMQVWEAATTLPAPKSDHNFQKDLANTSSHARNNKQKALEKAEKMYFSKNTSMKFTRPEVKDIIFIDENKIAHYAFLISFFVNDGLHGGHRPIIIMDAASLKIYSKWDGVHFLMNPGPLRSHS